MGDNSSIPATPNQCIGYAGHGEPILGLGVYLSTSPWRLGPVWAVLAGALASQAPVWGDSNLLRLGGSILLADAVWGVLWRRTAARLEVLPKRERGLRLPYSNARSPMMAFLSELRYDAGA